MALVKVKPTSAGRRALVKVVSPDLHKGRPLASLTERKIRGSGRNNLGRITTRHQGGGHKQHYRVIDFCRNKDGIAPRGLGVGAQVQSGQEAAIRVGNTLPLRNIPVGTTVHCVEMMPGKGAQLARAAGTPVQLLAREGGYAQIRLRSGEIRKVLIECRATIGEVGNEENNLRQFGKAGAMRWRGIRPTVRGVAMNPIDHPHGGGEGRTGTKRHPVSPWGQLTKGYRTRKNKRTNSMIVQRRYRK